MRAKGLKLQMIMVTHQYMAVDLYCKALRHFRQDSHMEMSATEFNAKCLALIDQVRSTREPVLIRKRGKMVAKLLPENLLPSSFHRDPAARIIVSTARVHGSPLLTKDRK